jgi:hypothetical protein
MLQSQHYQQKTMQSAMYMKHMQILMPHLFTRMEMHQKQYFQ